MEIQDTMKPDILSFHYITKNRENQATNKQLTGVQAQISIGPMWSRYVNTSSVMQRKHERNMICLGNTQRKVLLLFPSIEVALFSKGKEAIVLLPTPKSLRPMNSKDQSTCSSIYEQGDKMAKRMQCRESSWTKSLWPFWITNPWQKWELGVASIRVCHLHP